MDKIDIEQKKRELKGKEERHSYYIKQCQEIAKLSSSGMIQKPIRKFPFKKICPSCGEKLTVNKFGFVWMMFPYNMTHIYCKNCKYEWAKEDVVVSY